MVARALWISEARRVTLRASDIHNARATIQCALVGDPARAVGECRDVAKAQP